MSKEEVINLLMRLYQYGEEGLTIDANIAYEIEKMIDSLKSEPEPGEFTKEFRQALTCVANLYTGVPSDDLQRQTLEKLIVSGRDICDRIDRLTKENKKLKSKQLYFPTNHDYELELELKRKDIAALKAENKELQGYKDAILFLRNDYRLHGARGCPACEYDNGKFIKQCTLHAEIDRQQAEIDRLTENLQTETDGAKVLAEALAHANKERKSQQAEIARYESHICGAHQPRDMDTSKACPYCEAVKQRAEIERLKSQEPPCNKTCYHHQTHPCENCGRINGYLPSVWQALQGETQ